MQTELLDWCRAAGIPLSPSQDAATETFLSALYAHNELKNLTRIPREDAWRRHMVDSLLIHDLIPPGSAVLDIGTGPGFPAWPLAMARPDLRVTALDSNGKMLDFLRSQPLPNLEIVQTRIEDWPVRDRFDVVTGRALAPLTIQLEISAAPCRRGGKMILMRTGREEPQIRQFRPEPLGLTLKEIHERRLPGEETVRLLPVYEKTAPTPKAYPRPWAEIKRKPLG